MKILTKLVAAKVPRPSAETDEIITTIIDFVAATISLTISDVLASTLQVQKILIGVSQGYFLFV